MGSRFQFRLSTSAAALLIGGGVAPALAAPCNNVVGSYTNPTGVAVTNLCVQNTTFSGGIVNNGTVSPNGIAFQNATVTNSAPNVIQSTGAINGGISIDSRSRLISNSTDVVSITGSFAGGITNAGTIVGNQLFGTGAGIFAGGPAFSGGITNAGTITGGAEGIFVGAATFAGGVTNTGVLTGAGVGDNIQVGGFKSTPNSTPSFVNLTVSSFSGGIVNTGTMGVINVVSAVRFDGGIDNTSTGSAGTIRAGNFNFTGSLFTGGITNSGTLSGVTAISVSHWHTFSGGITNTGTFTNGIANPKISVGNVDTFLGDVVNSGTMVGGISLTINTLLSGAVTNSGKITTGGGGLGAGISVRADTLVGGVTNSGTITTSGVVGIIALLGQTFTGDILNAAGGSITATGTPCCGIGDLQGAINVDQISTFAGNVTNAGTLAAATGINVSFVSTFTGRIVNSGTITTSRDGIIWIFQAPANTTLAGTIGISNSGTITAGGNAIHLVAGGGSGITLLGGDISNAGSLTGSEGIRIESGYAFAAGHGIVNSGTIAGTGGTAIDVSGANQPMTITQNAGTIAGAIRLSAHADVLNVVGGTIAGNIVGQGASNTINFSPGAGNTFTYGPGFGFSGINQVNVTSGTTILDGANSATGVSVAGGTLLVGDAANASATLTGALGVGASGVLGGFGTIVGAVAINNAGTLSPGASVGTLTVNGSVSFNAGSNYAVDVTPSTSDRTNATGTATLTGGTVRASFASGSYIPHQYTILSASGGLGSTTFAGITTTNLPSNFNATLGYTSTDVLLNLSAALGIGGGLPGNQQNVANAINNFFNNGGTLPPGFLGLFGLSGSNLSNALSQLSGEPGADVAQSAFFATNLFLNALLDPDSETGGSSAMAFAAEGPAAERSHTPAELAAYAAVTPRDQPWTKAPPPTFDQRWSIWSAGYGGTGTTRGDVALGSHDAADRVFGVVGGATYRVSPDTRLGFGLGGAQTNFSLANGLGGGSADVFHAAVFGRHQMGAAYVAGALAYTWQDVTTDRTVMVAGSDKLEARFRANGVAARGEAGWRIATPVARVAPYAAIQAMTFFLPGYTETAISGSNQFALGYAAQTVTATRSELGARLDRSFALADGWLTLASRLAWAHDYNRNRFATATFQSLPGATFIVNGAIPAADAALVTAGAEYKIPSGWSVAAKFDGEFSATTSVYAGTGTLRKVW